jgi:hypothetical protein
VHRGSGGGYVGRRLVQVSMTLSTSSLMYFSLIEEVEGIFSRVSSLSAVSALLITLNSSLFVSLISLQSLRRVVSTSCSSLMPTKEGRPSKNPPLTSQNLVYKAFKMLPSSSYQSCHLLIKVNRAGMIV